MAYIGKSSNFAVRNRYVYQATAGQTSFSGSDADSKTLTYTDSLYMDVYQNGPELYLRAQRARYGHRQSCAGVQPCPPLAPEK